MDSNNHHQISPIPDSGEVGNNDTGHMSDGQASASAATRPVSPSQQGLPELQPPSEEEAKFFYYGLASQARLVGRTSCVTNPWESLSDQRDRHFAEKAQGKRQDVMHFKPRTIRLGPIGRHEIRDKWNGDLIHRFISKLERLPFDSVNVSRMLATDCHEAYVYFTGTVVVWVDLENNDTPWEVVSSVLSDCRQLLDSEGLYDVDVHLRAPRAVSPADDYTEPETTATA